MVIGREALTQIEQEQIFGDQLPLGLVLEL